MTDGGELGELGELRALLTALTDKVDRLTTLVEGLVAGRPPDVDHPAGDDVWQRLGLAEGERRTVTVLFADVSGFTELSEQLDPEAFQLVMRETMTLLAECVAAEGGSIEKFIGDAVCAVFGAPMAHQDEPQRAARTALAMHEALAKRAVERTDLPFLQVHIGINTGPVIAGTVGDGSQFGVMGDTINTAARLMNVAVHGETVVSAETAKRLRREFRLEDRGLHEVKGKAKPVAVSALLDVLGPDERAAARRLSAPLVGRDVELSTLRRLAQRTIEGDGTTVTLLGPAGVGLSRLARELTTELGAAGWKVLSSTARVQAETALGLVASALEALLDEPEAEAVGGRAGPLGETLAGRAPAAPHDFELVLGELVVAVARRVPLVVVLDDIHEADPGSVEVVRYLTRTTATEPILWLLLGEHTPAPFARSAGGDDVVVLKVAALTDAAVTELFDRLFPGALDDQQRRRLATLAEGNAEFAKEIAAALVDDGVLIERAQGWALAGDLDTFELPGSVAELVEARIDQLSTSSRITLQDASVIGLRFTERLLGRVATIPTAVEASLAELLDAELIDPPASTGGLWSFRSRLAREVAYGSLLKRRRPRAHRAVADALVDLEPERIADNADLLAHHYEQGDDPPLAIPHLLEAVDRAENAYNFTGALERARRGLRIRERFPGRVPDRDASALQQRVGINQLLLGDRSGLVALEQSVELLLPVGEPAEVAVLHEELGWYLTVAGEWDAAATQLVAAEHLAEGDGLDATARAAVLAGVAASRAYAAGGEGDLVEGVALVDGAVAQAVAAGDSFAQARALLVGGVLRLWSGDVADAIDHLRTCLELSWANVFGSLADRCGRWLVLAMVDAGRYADASSLAEPLLARADDRGDPSVACGVRAALASMWREVGDLDRARRLATEALERVDEGDVANDAAIEARLVLVNAAYDAARDAGSTAEAAADAARDAAAQLAALAAVIDADAWLAWRQRARLALARGRLSLVAGDLEGALDAVAAVRHALGSTPARRELLAADRLEGEARALQGDPVGVELVASALETAERIGSPYVVAATAAALARAAADVDPAVAASATATAAGARELLDAAASQLRDVGSTVPGS